MNAFIGIQVGKDITNSSMMMSQPALIKQILKELKLDNGNTKIHDIPSKWILTKSDSGPVRTQEWNYRSVIEMLMFLASSTGPDILFSVQQCAKFNFCQRRSREEAIKLIGRHLKKTQEKGIIMKPDNPHELDCGCRFCRIVYS